MFNLLSDYSCLETMMPQISSVKFHVLREAVKKQVIDDDTRAGQSRDVFVNRISFVSLLTHPDGGIALFNDAALCIAPPLQDLQGYAHRPGFATPAAANATMAHLQDSRSIRGDRGPAPAPRDAGSGATSMHGAWRG